jgi:hypothetical protein
MGDSIKPAGTLEFLTRHFAVLSAALVILGALSATVILYGYLSVFSWRLIWLVEYADILKVGLVTVAVISGFAGYISNYVSDIYSWMRVDPKSWRWSVPLMAAIWASSFGFWIYLDWHSTNPYYGLHLHLHFAIIAIYLLAFLIMRQVELFPTVIPGMLINDIAVMVLVVGFIGRTFGYYSRDMEAFKHDVALKATVLRDVGLIMVTSHHIVLYAEEAVIVVPSGDVTKITRTNPSR